jgi:hypothetical protein
MQALNRFNSSSSTANNVHPIVKHYNEIVQKRGYDAFSKQSIDAWKKEYAYLSPGNLQDMAEYDMKQFMNKVNDPAHPEHKRAADRFINEFKSNKDTAQKSFISDVFKANGRTHNNGSPFLKDTSYEKRITDFGTLKTMGEVNEHKLVCDVMQAKWNADGYDDHTDSDFLNLFVMNHCSFLKPNAPLGDPENYLPNPGGNPGGQQTSQERKDSRGTHSKPEPISNIKRK